MLQIEWKSSHYHSDGRPRSRPKASTVHGWLVKWRATFSGNECLRKEGIREMREAKAVRERKKQRRAARLAKAGASAPSCRLWPVLLGSKPRPSHAQKSLSRSPQRASPKRPGRANTRRPSPPDQSPRSTPANGRRLGHTRRQTVDRHPHSSRKASYDSRGVIVRVANKKRRFTAPS